MEEFPLDFNITGFKKLQENYKQEGIANRAKFVNECRSLVHKEFIDHASAGYSAFDLKRPVALTREEWYSILGELIRRFPDCIEIKTPYAYGDTWVRLKEPAESEIYIVHL